MKKINLTIVLLLNIFITYGQWQKANGPYGGNINCFAKSDKYVVAGSHWNESGVFVSSDFGDTWNKVTKTDKPSYQTSDIFVNSIVQGNSSDVFYVGSSGEGIYKLFRNNGLWELKTIGFRSENKSIQSVAFNKGILLAAFFGDGIYKSTDEGLNWSPVNNGLLNKSVVELKCSEDSVFAGTYDGLYLSKDLGNTWNLFSSELTGKYVTKVFLSDTIVYLGVFNEGTYTFSKKGKLLSKPVIAGSPILSPIGLIDGKLYGAFTTYGLYSSTIPIINWQKNTSFSDKLWPHSIIGNKDTLLVGVEGFGVYKSIDNGLTWKESSVGITAYKFNSMVVVDSVIYAATDINGIFSSNNKGQSWKRIVNSSAADMLINGNDIFLSNGYLSNDKGKSWNSSFTFYATCLASSGNTVYAGCQITGINYTNDHGKTWQHIIFPDSTKQINDIAVQDSVLLVGTALGGAYCSTDKGKSWQQINNGLTSQWINSVLIKDKLFFISVSPGVYSSSNYGQTWEAKNNGLTCVPTQLIVCDSIIYGAFPTNGTYSSNNGANWSTLNELPGLGAIASNSTYKFAGTFSGFYYYKKGSVTTDFVDYHKDKFYLSNFPNPFSEHTTIAYALENNEKFVTFSVYDTQGKIVYTRREENKPAGNYRIDFNANGMLPGLYFYNLRTANGSSSNKMLIVK